VNVPTAAPSFRILCATKALRYY